MPKFEELAKKLADKKAMEAKLAEIKKAGETSGGASQPNPSKLEPAAAIGPEGISEKLTTIGVEDLYEGLDPVQVAHLIPTLVEKKNVAALVDVMQHAKSRANMKSAISALVMMGDKTAIPALTYKALYGKGGLTVREMAVRALGEIGKGDVVELLIHIMGKGTHPGHAAIDALGEIGDDRASKPLAAMMNDANEAQFVRERAAEALGRIASPDSLAALISALDSDLSDRAMSVLKEMGSAVFEPLLSALASPNLVVRAKAVAILGEAALDRETAKALISIIESDVKDTTVIENAVAVLGGLGDKSATESLIKAFFKFGPANFGLVNDISQILGKIKDPGAVQPLLNALKPQPQVADDDYAIQCYTIWVLGKIGDKAATAPLLQMLLDKSNTQRVRLTAAMALGYICDEKAVQTLMAVLNDNRDDEVVRGYVFDALFKYPGDIAAGPMLKYLKAHPDMHLTQTEDGADESP